MNWEERWHPLREEWVVVAGHRNDRPWNAQTVAVAPKPTPSFVPDCYLCPGNTRVSGEHNPEYRGIYVFDNDHPCVSPSAPDLDAPTSSFYRRLPARGKARVVCYTPRHDLTLAELAVPQTQALLATWQEQYIELGDRPEVAHVLTFENKGEVVGVSNPHPHCQIYATNFIFKTTEVEVAAERCHFSQTGRVLFQDILRAEQEDGRRILCEADAAIAFVPFFARYPYEVFIAPKATHPSIASLSADELMQFAQVLHETLVRCDNLWQVSFPYVLVLHQAPTDGRDYSTHHFHVQLHPPLRKPHLLKYLAGPEIGGGCFLNDRTPESAATELRATANVHYKQTEHAATSAQ